jgi:hypothetical protein
MATVLFRAISIEERDDLRATGRFRIVRDSCEGKHLATTIEDARKWGEAFYGTGRFAVVRVEISERMAARFYHWPILDGIGPAYFATIEQLSEALIEEVSDEF